MIKRKNMASRLLFVSMLMAIALIPANAQNSTKETAVQNMVESAQFVFKANTALPMRGSARQLTSDYDVKVTKDAIVSYLPYFGRAYSPSIDPSKGALDFTSNSFVYKSEKAKKGGWNISIKPKDIIEVQQLQLYVSPKGYTTLQVSSTNRESITFNGYIAEKK